MSLVNTLMANPANDSTVSALVYHIVKCKRCKGHEGVNPFWRKTSAYIQYQYWFFSYSVGFTGLVVYLI